MVTRRHARLTTARKGARPTTGDGSGAVTPERRDAFVSRTSTAILLAGLFGAVIVGKVKLVPVQFIQEETLNPWK